MAAKARTEAALGHALSRVISFEGHTVADVHGAVLTLGPELLLLANSEPDACAAGLKALADFHSGASPVPGEWLTWHRDRHALYDLGAAYGLLADAANPVTGTAVRDRRPIEFGPLYLVRRLLQCSSRAVRLLVLSKFTTTG